LKPAMYLATSPEKAEIGNSFPSSAFKISTP